MAASADEALLAVTVADVVVLAEAEAAFKRLKAAQPVQQQQHLHQRQLAAARERCGIERGRTGR